MTKDAIDLSIFYEINLRRDEFREYKVSWDKNNWETNVNAIISQFPKWELFGNDENGYCVQTVSVLNQDYLRPIG